MKSYGAATLIGSALIIIVAGLPQRVDALELKPSQVRAKSQEKPVSVLQRRYFKKKWRPEFGVLFGQMLNEAYTDTEKRGVRAGLFANEWFGLELQYIDTTVVDSEDREALDQLKFKRATTEEGEDPDTLVSPQPEINRIKQIIDATLIFAPFYGKINIMDSVIIYSDFYIAFGGSQLETDQGSKAAMTMGLGQRFYMFKSLSMRIDFRNHSFAETRAGKDNTRNEQSWDLGFSWFFF